MWIMWFRPILNQLWFRAGVENFRMGLRRFLNASSQKISQDCLVISMIFFLLHPYDYDPQWLIFFRGVGTVGTPSEIIDAPDWANSNDLIDFVG